ncbi:MAG: hypothetical protein AABY22_30655, partial [Nanoarchaeota archaeon]
FGLGGIGGAGLGLAIGLFSELPSIFKAFSDTLPDLQKNLEKLKQISQQSSVSMANFIDASEKLGDVFSNRITGLTNNQVSQLRGQQFTGLAGIPDIGTRERLRELTQSGNLRSAREFAQNADQINTQRLRAQELQIKFKNFAEKFKSKNIETPEQAVQRISSLLDIEGLSPEAKKIRLDFIKKDFTSNYEKAINEPKLSQEIQQSSSEFVSQLFGLTSIKSNKAGVFESFFNALTKDENIGKVDISQRKATLSEIRGLADTSGFDKDFISVLKEIGTTVDIDVIALNNLLKAFKELPGVAQKDVIGKLSRSSLTQDVEGRKLFISNTIQSNRVLIDFSRLEKS